MNVKTILVMFSLMLITSINANAQSQMNIERRMENLTKVLDLTENQQVEIKKVFTTQKSKFDNIQVDDRTTRREEMQKIMTETNSMILPILDEEQQKEFKKRIEQQMQKRGSDNQRQGSNKTN